MLSSRRNVKFMLMSKLNMFIPAVYVGKTLAFSLWPENFASFQPWFRRSLSLIHRANAVCAFSPPQRPLCIVGRAGERGKESTRGKMGRGKRRIQAPTFFLFPSSPACFLRVDYWYFYLGYPTGASAEEGGMSPTEPETYFRAGPTK